jgi:rubrerythrin
MKGNFDASKLLETLILLEQTGYNFYLEIASQMKDSKAKNLFVKLAQDEQKHEQIYTDLLGTLQKNQSTEVDVEDAEYLELLISTNFFVTSPEEIEKAKKSYAKEDALAIAEQLERDTITFLYELMQLNLDVDVKEIRFALAEEKRHLKSILQREFESAIPLLGL